MKIIHKPAKPYNFLFAVGCCGLRLRPTPQPQVGLWVNDLRSDAMKTWRFGKKHSNNRVSDFIWNCASGMRSKHRPQPQTATRKPQIPQPHSGVWTQNQSKNRNDFKNRRKSKKKRRNSQKSKRFSSHVFCEFWIFFDFWVFLGFLNYLRFLDWFSSIFGFFWIFFDFWIFFEIFGFMDFLRFFLDLWEENLDLDRFFFQFCRSVKSFVFSVKFSKRRPAAGATQAFASKIL